MKRKSKKIISVFLAILMAVTGVMPAVTAFAGDGVENFWDIQMFYKDTDTIVPEYVDETAAEKQEYVETMKEGQKLNLTYKLLNAEMPDNSYVKWYSDMPTLVDVDQNGVVKAFDSSKGAIMKLSLFLLLVNLWQLFLKKHFSMIRLILTQWIPKPLLILLKRLSAPIRR